jgi:hypothetical protein
MKITVEVVRKLAKEGDIVQIEGSGVRHLVVRDVGGGYKLRLVSLGKLFDISGDLSLNQSKFEKGEYDIVGRLVVEK